MLSTLLSILLLILKIIGIILLVILGLILLILIVPIRYQFRVSDREEETLKVYSGVSWFLVLLRVRAQYIEKEFLYDVKLFGIPLLSNHPDFLKKKEEKAKKKADKKKAKAKKNNEKKDSEIPSKRESEEFNKQNDEELMISAEIEEDELLVDHLDEESVDTEIKDEVKEEGKNEPIDVVEKKTEDKKKKSLHHKKKDKKKKEKKSKKSKKSNEVKHEKEKSGKNIIESISTKIDAFKKKATDTKNMIDEYQVIYLVGVAKNVLIRILKHILPRSIRGFMNFGFDDPSLTGKACAIAALFYPAYGKSFMIEPDFNRSCFAGEFEGKGRIRLGFFVWILITLLLKKEVRKLIRLFLK